MSKMLDSELLTLIEVQEAKSIGSTPASNGVGLGTTTGVGQFPLTTTEIDRYNALNYYYARPFGNEQNDRSQVVLPELRDTIEWLLPQLMRIYAGCSTICMFDPVNPGDEQQAEQETDAVNYVFLKQNGGTNLLYDAFKDALLLKNYYFKVGWDKKKQSSVESYTGLTPDELTKLFMDAKENGDELEVLEQNANTILLPGLPGMAPQAPRGASATPQGVPPSQPPPAMPAQVPQPMVVKVYDVRIRRTTSKGQVVVECVPPEDMRISTRARFDLDDSPFTAYISKPTRSELISMGFDKEIVMSIPPARPDWSEMDKLARDSSLDEMSDTTGELDPSLVEVEFKEVEMRVDYDGDGVAELRRILVGGNHILENEEIPFSSFASGTPCRMSHRHIGMSIYDIMADLQQIKSTLFRQALDNIYLANNSRTAVNDDVVNLDDLMTNRPGGIVRVKGAPSESIMPLMTQGVLTEIQPLVQYVDQLRTMRTGVGEATVGLDPDALQNVTNPNGAAGLSAAMLKIEMMAILLGEGLKTLFQKIHAQLIMHQDEKMDINLRGDWVEINPSQWRTRTQLTLNIGLGSGNRQELRQNVVLLGQMQAQAAPLGLVGPKQAYNTVVKGLEGLGLQNGRGTYFLDPDSPEFAQMAAQKQQQQQAAMANDPRAKVAQGQLQIAQFKAQSEAQQEQAQGEREMAQIQLQAQKNMAEARMEADLAMQKQAAGAQLDMQSEAGKLLLNFISQIAQAAIKANAPPQVITQDVGAAEQAARSVQ